MLLSTRISSLRAFKPKSLLNKGSRAYLNTEFFSSRSFPRSSYPLFFSRIETFNGPKPFKNTNFSLSNKAQERFQSVNSKKPSPIPSAVSPPEDEQVTQRQYKTWLDRLPPKVTPYIYMTRLDKPIGTWLLYWPCAWSISMASYSANVPISQTAWMLGLFGAGAMIMRGAGCTINDLWDKDIDSKIERTKSRPLASGAITPAQAITFLSLQLSAGLAILTQLNWYSIKLGAASLSLVTLYPFMKRVTYWPQFILGTAFNWGALLGWSAVLGSSNWPVTIPLYMGGICWTLVYDTIYAHQDKRDDIHAGVKSTALYFGSASPQYLTFFSGSFLALLSLSGYMNSQGVPFYVISVGGAAAHLGWQLKNIKYDDPKDCWNKFASNFWVGAVVWGGIVTDWVWKSGAAAYTDMPPIATLCSHLLSITINAINAVGSMPYNICMVSDFFYPNMGGVESHLYHLSQRLIQRGHKVVIITHAYGNRTGVRYLTNGLKVYHVPMMVIYAEATLPTIYSFFPIFRYIAIREQIDIVHGHGAFSSLCHEAILHGKTMGLKACFTDHSLFGFADTSSILTNKLLKFTMSDVNHVICVSHTSKENTVLRAALNPQMVSVIPNAVVASQFKPDPQAQDPNWITIVVISRQTYRKGMDLLVAVIPRICQQHPKVRFIIGGDGPKRIDLEQMREKHILHDRVELVGSVKHSEVRSLLIQGQIFLNPSLTEAFGIGMVEAACCGLFVVSTRVGGVPEILPPHMIQFAKPEEDDLVGAVSSAIYMIRMKEVVPARFHDDVKQYYSWVNVAERTEKVYDLIYPRPEPPLIERFRRYYGCGVFAGKIFCFVIALDYLLWIFLEWWFPRESIDIAPSFPYKKYRKLQQSHETMDVS